MSDRRPSICFVAPNAFPLLARDEETPVIGGAELQQVTIAKGLAARGYPVSMICLNFGQQDRVEIDGVKVFRACRPDEGIPILRFVWPRLASIWSCLKRCDADIYYQRAAGMLTGVVAAFARRHAKKSVFAAAGNPDFERKTPRIRYARDRWIYEYGLRHVARILTQNEEQARLCRLNFERDSTQIPNCYAAAANQAASANRHVLWVSTIRKLKRPELFLDVAEALPAYRFQMIGGPGIGEAQLFDSIKARAETIPNVEFLGFVPFSKVEGHFDEASIFVNTSDSEGFPNTFLQAWSRGIPTVSFVDSGARAEGDPLGRQVNTVEEMADCVAAWLRNNTERTSEGERCRKYFASNHSPERVLDLYEEFFGELVTRYA